ncbi:hypothetical protein HLH33_00555 [Gluconacetobacter diazotrophicus]|uniref:Uncharacterized protein n=1 Tax=Gluconacetobacter diazotrophicus TaxID=33996 RepID=A0A7W4FBR3_GLUDI|nr:hypothetical protein [Gluconacetobacter diazotrophicus]MBB2154811.1 hypothetical protein [Gluconacetobacter diazotrophicus]
MSAPEKSPGAENAASYRARKLASGWADLRIYVPKALRREIRDAINRRLRIWKYEEDKAEAAHDVLSATPPHDR